MGDDWGNERRRRNRQLSSGRGATPNSANMDRDPRWRENAKCRGADAEIFFPVGPARSGPTSPERVAYDEAIGRARAVCADCECRDDCLAFALTTDQDGVWGGTSVEERRRLRKVRRSA